METLNELLDKQIELLTDQRSALIYAITDADENSPNYEEKISELKMEISGTDERIDNLLDRVGSDVQIETKERIHNLNIPKMGECFTGNYQSFNYGGVDYDRGSVIKGINHASENEVVNAKDSDVNLQIEINKLSGAGISLFESQLKRVQKS